jgi:zinc protease
MRFYSVSKAICVSLLIVIFSIPSFAQELTRQPDPAKGATVEGITEYRLPNGLRVLLFPDNTKQTITVNITYLVGSRHENYGETGMAHLLEHMVFKGTPNHPNIPQELTTHGARPNGSTWYDRTNYFETFAATDENLAWAIDLEADRMINSFIARKDLDSEFSVVRNEMESGENSPYSITSERVLATAYEWHNYGKDTIGARSDVENVPIDRLQAFYHKYYQPDNAVLLVTGKIDEQKTLSLINQKFGMIPKPARELPKIYTAEPVQDGERMVTVRRVGDTQLAIAGYHVAPDTHPDIAAVDILEIIMTDDPSGRLYKSLVETKKATSVFSLNFPFKDPGYLMLGAELGKDGALDAVRDGLTETIENFASAPPSKEEVERAKAQILKNIDLTLSDPNRVGLGMSEVIAQGDWRLFFIYRDRVKAATPADVQRVAKAYFKRSNRTVGLFVPTQTPDRAEVPNVSDDAIAALVKDYKGGEAIAAGEAFDPSPANVETRTKRSTIGGLQVAFLPKENRGDSVMASITLRFGDDKTLMNRGPAASMAGQMLMRGTSKHTRQQIQDELNRLKAQVFLFGGATSAGAQIETTRQNLPAVIKLVAEMFRDSTFPQAEFDQLKQEQITGLEGQRSEPQSIAFLEMGKAFNIYPKGHPLYQGTIDENLADIKSLTLDDAKKFYKDFYGASNGQMTVVGDFDEKETADLVKTSFSDWKSPQPFTRIKGEYRDISVISKNIETPDKANAMFVARLNVKLRDDNPDYPALVLGNYILGGGFLNSRLATRIRQKEGLSYGVGSNFGASSLDETGSFQAYAIYAPENAEKLEAAFRDEIAKMLKDGFTAQEIEQAKAGWIQAQQLSRAQDRELTNRLQNYLFINRTVAWDAALAESIKNLTAEQIVAAMRKYIDPAKISIVKAGDFAKSKAKAPGE